MAKRKAGRPVRKAKGAARHRPASRATRTRKTVRPPKRGATPKRPAPARPTARRTRKPASRLERDRRRLEDIETAYFSGDEAPGGDNPTPDQDIVENIGRALGVEYQDNEELRPADKVADRDRHRWELDPASSEDYKERK
jgi:hypothetical protein